MELCNCGAPVESKENKLICDNCGFFLTDEITLDIDNIPEELYQALLDEFKRQLNNDHELNGECLSDKFGFVNWNISAVIAE